MRPWIQQISCKLLVQEQIGTPLPATSWQWWSLELVAEEGRGENEVVPPVNPATNAAANAAANPPANAAANATGNVANNAANATGTQPNAAANPRQNAGAQPPPAQANHAEGSQRRRIRDKVEIARCANYVRDHGVPDPLDANNPIQATDLRQMHNQELLRRAQYDQNNGPPNDLYIIPTAYAPSASPGAVNNFPAFSRRLRTIRYPKYFKPALRNMTVAPTQVSGSRCKASRHVPQEATKTTWRDTSPL
jgi:hypothetical protein